MADDDGPVTFRALTPEAAGEMQRSTVSEACRLAVQLVEETVTNWLTNLPLELQVEVYRRLAGRFFDLGDRAADELLGLETATVIPDPEGPDWDEVDLGQHDPPDGWDPIAEDGDR